MHIGTVAALLKNHIIPHPVCKSAVIGEHKMRTDADNRVEFNCDKSVPISSQHTLIPSNSNNLKINNSMSYAV